MNILYLQSGGPTSVINCSCYGVIKQAKTHPEVERVYGARYGIEGLLNGDLIDLFAQDEKQIELLKQTPGVILGSSRMKLGKDPEIFEALESNIRRYGIEAILVNGGNDSMDTALWLHENFHGRVRVIGIPKTIDNDLAVTDHSIGFPSAAKHVLEAVKAATRDARSYRTGKIVLIEIMGREAGWLTASVDLLSEEDRPDLIYLPEMNFDEKTFEQDIQRIFRQKGCVVAAISEGLDIQHDTLALADAFGHISPEGVCEELGHRLKDRLGVGVRTIQLSTMTRADPTCLSKVDVDEAIRCGQAAVEAVFAGESGKMVGLSRVSQDPYRSETILIPLEEVANVEAGFPVQWLDSHSHLDQAFRDYLLPLLQGNVDLVYEEDGTVAYARFENRK